MQRARFLRVGRIALVAVSLGALAVTIASYIDLRSRVDELEAQRKQPTEIDRLQGAVLSSHDSRIETLEVNLGGVDESRVVNVEDRIDDLESQVEELQPNSFGPSLEDRISDLEHEVDSLTGVTGRAADLDYRLSDAESDITDLEDYVCGFGLTDNLRDHIARIERVLSISSSFYASGPCP
jgi:hypothetical protein